MAFAIWMRETGNKRDGISTTLGALLPFRVFGSKEIGVLASAALWQEIAPHLAGCRVDYQPVTGRPANLVSSNQAGGERGVGVVAFMIGVAQKSAFAINSRFHNYFLFLRLK